MAVGIQGFRPLLLVQQGIAQAAPQHAVAGRIMQQVTQFLCCLFLVAHHQVQVGLFGAIDGQERIISRGAVQRRAGLTVLLATMQHGRQQEARLRIRRVKHQRHAQHHLLGAAQGAHFRRNVGLMVIFRAVMGIKLLVDQQAHQSVSLRQALHCMGHDRTVDHGHNAGTRRFQHRHGGDTLVDQRLGRRSCPCPTSQCAMTSAVNRSPPAMLVDWRKSVSAFICWPAS